MFKVNFKTQTTIKAPASRIWEIIRHNPNYKEWNSFTPVADIDWELGGKVVLSVNMNTNKNFITHKARISVLKENYRVSWKMNWGILLKAERSQIITEQEDGTCIYYTDDVNEGLLAPLVKLLYGKKIHEGFKNLSEGLKSRAEQ